MNARVVVIGAGVAGLVSALDLAARGVEVLLLERAATPGGKLRQIDLGGQRVDAGPTVFTMRWVFDELFADLGREFGAELSLRPARILARHSWDERGSLDLFADVEQSCDAIGQFAGRDEAERFRRFCQDARAVYQTLETPFIRSSRPSPFSLVRRAGLKGLPGLWQIRPFTSLWNALGSYFRDPRLRQLFGRYATYCGSSPFSAPATLMLVAHVEQDGVWLIDGGMQRLAQVLARTATDYGVTLRYDSHVAEILVRAGRVAGVRLESGEILDAAAVVVNADPAAIAAGQFGAAVAATVPRISPERRSLSAVTWTLHAETSGFPLIRHSVFFSNDYAAEFSDIFSRKRLPAQPTVYICAQDRDDQGERRGSGAERLLCLVNAPAIGDTYRFEPEEIAACEANTFERLRNCGLVVHRQAQQQVVTTPTDFNRLFPATGGALYGASSHGWAASFNRPGARTRVPGLYLAGGSIHPGPGVPMAALSGRRAALHLLEDLASIARSRTTATFGGT